MISPKIIAIVGGSGSGKTTFALKLKESIDSFLGRSSCELIGQDNYYRNLEEQKISDFGINFDHPDSLDFSLLRSHLKKLKSGQPIDLPTYDYSTHSRGKQIELIQPKDFIIIDGTLLLCEEYLRDLFDESIFLDISEELRFNRRLSRDTKERGRTNTGVQHQFRHFVKPMHDTFVQPSKKHASQIFNCNQKCLMAIPNLITNWTISLSN